MACVHLAPRQVSKEAAATVLVCLVQNVGDLMPAERG